MAAGKQMEFTKKKQGVYSKINKKFFEQNNEAILAMLGSDAVKVGDFKYAQRILLHLKFIADFYDYVFSEWGKQVRSSEKELLIVRFVLA
jgi:GTP cyclohydrolase I